MKEYNGLEIAVIGMAGRFPAAQNIEQYWQLLHSGSEGIKELEESELVEQGLDKGTISHRDYVKRAGFVARKKCFDAELFGYSAAEAQFMDPQFGVFHEVVWEALETAGYTSENYDGLIGLYAGASSNTRWLRKVDESLASSSMADGYALASVNEPGYLCSRVSHKLNLTGPAISNNTTCSTSLVNIHLACQALNIGECDIALAGGVYIGALAEQGYLYQEDMILSPDGVCRPFDELAQGTVPGEGCGVLVLKRLEDAVEDNDNILAVIKGSAINNDGENKVGFTAPSVSGQAQVISDALQRAEISPDSIQYIETHGTATKIGDPIEISALKQVFDEVEDCRIAIGSVKSNIGHAGEAAGVAGAIKTILSMQHKTLPASLNYTAANPLLHIENSPFYVNQHCASWDGGLGGTLRAGVSSFGLGGSNAHVIFEDHQEQPYSGPSRDEHLISLSANTDAALIEMENNLAEYIAKNPDASIADIAYTLHLGRKSLKIKSNFVAKNLDDLKTQLQGKTKHTQIEQSKTKTLCFLFPGQGAQYINMGRDIFDTEPVFKASMLKGFDLYEQSTGVALQEMLYPANEYEARELIATEYAQPALFIFEYALFELFTSWGCDAKAFLGHSLGEYVAACAAGVMSYEDALTIVAKRGQLVASMQEGAMLAVAAKLEEVESYICDGLAIAALNAPHRVVVSGDKELIQQLQRQLQEQQISATQLHTSHAMHSAHLEPILSDFKACMSNIALNAPHTPFLSNLTGDWADSEQVQTPLYWEQHLRHTVKFADCAQVLLKDPDVICVELGPGNTLSQLVAQNGVGNGAQAVSIATTRSAKQHVQHAESALLASLSQLQLAGYDIDWTKFYDAEQRCRVALPTYPFANTCYYAPELMRIGSVNTTPQSSQVHDEVTHAEEHQVQSMRLVSSDAGLTGIQSQLLAIWSKYLANDTLKIDDNLLNLGVDSLMSIRVITEIRETFEIELSIDTIFTLATVAEQADEIQKKRDASAHDLVLPPIYATGKTELSTLSTSQQRLWMISQLEDGLSAYNNAFCVFIKNVCIASMKKTLSEIVNRHSILRTRYRNVNGQPVQQITDNCDVEIITRDVSDVCESERMDAARALFDEFLLEPTPLEDGVMVRAFLIKFDAHRDILCISQHHICSDNWTVNILVEEMSKIYLAYTKGEAHDLPPLPIQYIDYADWQSRWLGQNELANQIEFWKEYLLDAPDVNNLPTDFTRPKYQSYRGAQYIKTIGNNVLGGLNRLSQEQGTTLYMTMQAAFSSFIGRYSNEDDIIVGFQVANRLQKEVEPLVGFFVNTLVLRSDLTGDPTFSEFLATTKQNLLKCYSNSHLPFESLVDELNPNRSLSYEPIAQIQLVYMDQSQTVGGGRGDFDEEQAQVFESVPFTAPFSKYDLTLYFRVLDTGVECVWEYATDLFRADTIERMADNFECLLSSIIAQPSQTIRALPMLSEQEKSTQYVDWHTDSEGSLSHSVYNQLTASEQQIEGSEKSVNFSLFFFANDAGDSRLGKYNLLMQGAKFADQHGFEAVWTPERHFGAFGGLFPNPAITAAAIAGMTERVKIRAGSCVLPLHNPVRVAEDWSVIDNISGGRIGLGFAAGWSPQDFVLAPQGYESRRDDLQAGIKTVKSLWKGETLEMPSGNGKIEEVSIRPRPIQTDIPIWTTTAGHVDAFIRAGQAGQNVLTHLLGQSLDDLADKVAAYRDAWKKAGHMGHGTVTLLAHTFIAENEAVIFDHVKEPFKRYLVTSAGSPQEIARLVGESADMVLSGDLNQSDELNAITERAFMRYYHSNALLGTVDSCKPTVEKIAASGVNEIACLVDFGVDESLVLDNLQNLHQLKALFTESVEKQQADLKLSSNEVTDVLSSGSQWCLHTLFEQTAAQLPSAIALKLDGETLTYAELNDRANRLANYLIEHHQIVSEQVVALCLGRSFEMYIAILAVLKSGGAYVAIDPSLPQQRTELILSESQAELLLTRAEDIFAYPLQGVSTVYTEDSTLFSDYSPANLDIKVTPSQLSNIIYTSGSTGTPKGIMIEHRNMTRLFDACPTAMKRTAHDIGCAFHSYVFDVSGWEMWGSLLHGGQLVLIPDTLIEDMGDLYRLLVDEKVTHLSMTPSAFYTLQSLFDVKNHALSLVNVNLAGEALNFKMLRPWYELDTQNRPRFFNVWAPAEVTVYASAREISQLDIELGISNIGAAFNDMALCILNEKQQPQPIGVPGELYAGGAGVSRGYLNNTELTAKSFISNPLVQGEKDIWYRTGDICRWMPDGSLEFMERKDRQVKLRGLRVELSEIDVCLNAFDGIKEAVVLAEKEGAEQYLVAYLVLEDSVNKEKLFTHVKQTLINQLPAYMIPNVYTVIDDIPRNVSGKIDKEALKLKLKETQQEYIEPRTETERVVHDIWAEVLGLKTISVTSNFFALGGQSLLAINVVNKLMTEFGFEIKTKLIFEYSSVESISALIDSVNIVEQNENGETDLEHENLIEFEL
ncbi:non-ribosomal peptide synthetase/type I polyketide synthase [Pseudoalteromonas luteoviolacea]|uniref:non-ribosomal peptide synthetase/type I polyketide synthase n=1 Tax=Pseudoalteromonas luteoviolacea TaxID=43657 RepID=UPI001B36B8B9|nr:non-ribosomal peptide synthetase/type I polyketide synthase [Pseudoalteromonas luteoviolacea]MBQ4835999.1 amino acid adenylation domain-containing protein [Pseudoalteromonas luteoviolacea]